MSKLSPRQRIALVSPLVGAKGGAQQEHCRRNGNWVSALTFDLRSVPEELQEDVKTNQFGIWHGQGSQIRPAADGSEDQVRLILGRLVSGVGIGSGRWKKDDDGTIHVFKLGFNI